MQENTGAKWKFKSLAEEIPMYLMFMSYLHLKNQTTFSVNPIFQNTSKNKSP